MKRAAGSGSPAIDARTLRIKETAPAVHVTDAVPRSGGGLQRPFMRVLSAPVRIVVAAILIVPVGVAAILATVVTAFGRVLLPRRRR